MNRLKLYALTVALISGSALSHDIETLLKQAHQTNRQTELKEQITDKHTDIKWNAATAAGGLVLFAFGTQYGDPIQSGKVRWLSFILGSIFTGAGAYFGLHDVKDLLRLKKKLHACADQSSE